MKLNFKLNIYITIFLAVILTSWPGLKAQEEEVPANLAPVKAPFEMPEFKRPQFPDATFNIIDFGAREMARDKGFKNTEAIHNAIEAAYQAGGGKVIIPEGEWLTGPIHMKSNINLHISEGATVHFSQDKEDYLPVVRQRHEGVEAYNYSPMIYAKKVNNVAITGSGLLNAHGRHWWEWAEEHDHGNREVATKTKLSRRKFGKGAGLEGMRPNFMIFWKSNNILVEGITLKDSPMWNVHLVYSKNIIVRDVTVQSLDAPNGDGVILDSSRDALVEYNHFETGDDAVVLKSGLNEEGLEIDIPTKDIVVRNFKAVDVRTGSGGIVFGSETSGGIKNVYVHNAYFEGGDRGIRFKSERGRGNIVENIYIHDIEMKDLSNEAINFNTLYSGHGVKGPSPLFRNVKIHDIQIDGVPNPIVLIGLPDKWLENLTLANIVVKNAEEGALISRVKNLTLKNVEIHAQGRAMVAEDVFELNLQNLELHDQHSGPSFLLKGKYSGAVNLKSFSADQIEYGGNVNKKEINFTE